MLQKFCFLGCIFDYLKAKKPRSAHSGIKIIIDKFQGAEEIR